MIRRPPSSPLSPHPPLSRSRRDLAASREIVLRARRVPLPPRLVGAPATGRGDAAVRPGTRHKRSGYELGAGSEEHTSELQSPCNLVCRLLLGTKKQEASRNV